MMILACSSAALVSGFVLDSIFGDPYRFPHIVRWMGSLIAAMEKALRQTPPTTRQREKRRGFLLVFMVTLICIGTPFAVLCLSYRFSLLLGYIMESFLCYQLLAAKSLKTESMKVYHSLRSDDAEGARKNVSMIVGRDTSVLDRDGMTRATVETIAENASDGVAAPLLYMMLGGAVAGCLYKAVNTMDSMVGYKNEDYLYFGQFAAKTDDAFNYIPSRVCALLMIISAYLLRLDGKNAYRVWKRDRHKHSSPNSAQTEAVCAGALGVRLAGPAVYHGVAHDKPYIGDDTRPITENDIVSANRLMYTASVLILIAAILFRAVCWGALYLETL